MRFSRSIGRIRRSPCAPATPIRGIRFSPERRIAIAHGFFSNRPMNRSLLASFPAYTLQPAPAVTLDSRRSPTPLSAQLTPVVRITALLSCTPISGAPVAINSPGRYRLTRDLAVKGGTAITIQSSDVTLDLNGFTISSSARPAFGSAISIVGARRNVTIRNGKIRNTTPNANEPAGPMGFLFGVSGGNPAATQLIVQDLEVTGMSLGGIVLSQGSPSTIVERCVVQECPGIGILASMVRDCTA